MKEKISCNREFSEKPFFDKENAHFSTAHMKVPLQTLELFELDRIRTECKKITVLMIRGLWETDSEVEKKNS